jgi:hypothetical protein
MDAKARLMTDGTAIVRNGSLRTAAVLAFLFLAVMGAGLTLTPDPVRPPVDPGRFDALAARERLVRVLGDQAPHPVDSAAQDGVRERLLREIAALGFAPEVRDSFACRPQPRNPLIDCARVRNIVFSAGPEEGPAVLAAAHYDSVPTASGASDDGAGLAVWLEVARLIAREQPKRRVIFLFTDGEEPALLGAHAFATTDPLMASVEALVNLEARGTRGPAIFFESNPPNGDAVAAFHAAPRPIANSVMADVYRLLSNSTDVTALARPGLDVLNVSLLDGYEDYHTPQDVIASQDPRSIQHMGDVALAVTRRLAGAADADRTTPMIYTDIASRVFISAPALAGRAMLALSLIIAFAAFWRAGAEARCRTLAAPFAGAVLAGVLSAAVGFALSAIRPGEAYWFAHPEPTRVWCVLLALLGVVLGLLIMRASRSPEQAGAAGLFWFALIGGAGSIPIEGLSILFALPLLAYVLGWVASLVWKPAERIGLIAAALIALIVWAPMLSLLELALGFDMPFALTLCAALMSLAWIGVIV